MRLQLPPRRAVPPEPVVIIVLHRTERHESVVLLLTVVLVLGVQVLVERELVVCSLLEFGLAEELVVGEHLVGIVEGGAGVGREKYVSGDAYIHG